MPHFSPSIMFKYINGLTWLIIIAFISVIFTMVYFSPGILWDGIFLSVPLIIATILLSNRASSFLKRENHLLSKSDRFFQDFFLINYSFFLAILLSLLFEYDNSDVHGWWPVIIALMFFYGLVFSLIYSVIALILNEHKFYSIFFSFIVFFALLFVKFAPYYIDVLYVGSVSSFTIICFILIGLHLLICSCYKLYVLSTN